MDKSILRFEKSRVTRVAGVTTFIHAAYGVTPSEKRGVAAHVNIACHVTPITPTNQTRVTRKPAHLLDVTFVTLVTPKKTGWEVGSWRHP